MQFSVASQDLCGKGLIEFDKVEARELEVVLLFHFAQGGHRTDSHDARVHTGRRYGQNASQRFETVLLNKIFTRKNYSRGAVSDARRIAGGDSAGLRKNGGKFGHFFGPCTSERMLVAIQNLTTFLALQSDWNELGLETPGRQGMRGSSLGTQRELILFLSSDLVLFREHFGGFSHHHLGQRTKKSVAVHAIDKFLVAQAVTPAGAI